jgi:hypothetical protein
MPYKNPEDAKKRNKKHYQENKKTILEKAHKYYRKNKNKIAKNKKRYYKENLVKIKQYRENRKLNEPYLLHWTWAKNRCENTNNKNYSQYGERGIKFKLTKEEIKKLWYRDKASNLKQPSLDRKDGNKNYTYANCHFVEMDYNRRKPKSKRKRNSL